MGKEYEGYRIFWGDMHTNVHGKDIYFPPLTVGRLRRIMLAAKEHLDFFAIAYYPFEWYINNGLIIESCEHRKRFDDEWKLIQKAVKEAYEPGKFVTFLGYEWHGDRRRYGDHNVYYLEDDGLLDFSKEIDELYINLRDNNGIAVPHHTGYQVGERGKDWNFYDEELSPIVEIYSSHGSSEATDAPRFLDSNFNMGPGTSGGTVQDGLNRGYKFGIIASGDNHRDFPGVWGNGLAAFFSKELTKEALWETIKKRRVYGVTGDRIKLFFSINGHIMGQTLKSKEPANIFIETIGSDAIDRVQIIKDGKIFYTYPHLERSNKLKVKDQVTVKIRILCGWGPTSFYGFKNVKSKKLKGLFKVSVGEIISVEPCFTFFGQRIKQVSPRECEFTFTIQSRIQRDPITSQHHKMNFQGAVFEVKTHLDSVFSIQVDRKNVEFTVNDALERERIISLTDASKKIVYNQFKLRQDNVENPDIYWHNSWKLKISKAVPREAYQVKINYVDKDTRMGEHYYYVRVIQSNGQMAWSSPIWVCIKT